MPQRPSIAVALVAAAALAGCQATGGAPEPVVNAIMPPDQHSGFGIDLSAMDPDVAPGDSFFLYVNGAWYRNAQFAPDETYIGARMSLINQRRERIRSLIEKAAASQATDPTSSAVGTFYRSFLNTDAINAAGLAPARADLARIRAITTHEALFELFASAPASAFPSPIAASTFYDFHNPGWIRLRLAPGGLGLPREAYFPKDEAGKQILGDYAAYLAGMLKAAGETEAESKAEAVLALETTLAQRRWSSAEAVDFMKTANSLSIAELQALTPDFDWQSYIAHSGAGGIDTVIVTQPDSMKPLIETIRATPLATWRAWAAAHYLSENAPYLGDDLGERRFAFFGRRLGGQEAQQPRWERAVQLVEQFFGMGVGRLYVEEYFSPRDRAAVSEIFANIRSEMRDRIRTAEWMSETTRNEALRKIDTLKVKIGYPDEWPDYAALTINRDDFFGNLGRARSLAWRERMAMIQQPIPADKWQTTPQMSGAAANPIANEITVPAGALEPPYYDADADPAVNYGAIGGVLGHELSHMFDLLGRQFDADGNLRDWWAPEDAARYLEIAARVEKQYSAFEAAPNLFLDGKVTQNENIADISGLTLAHAAYHRAHPDAGTIAGFTPDQRLFMGWAQMRAGKMRDTMLRQQVARGPHSPDYFRVDGVVRNIDAWYRAFDIAPSAALYLAPEERARFW
jgi:predicted metalloendopeptidase